MKKQVLESQHIDFFDQHGCIVFHDLLPTHVLADYRFLLAKICTTRNVWKHSEVLKKLSFNHSFACIAAELSRLKQLRFAFDQYFPSFESLLSFLTRAPSLNALNSIDGLEIALLLNLSDTTAAHEITPASLPSIGGSGTFFTTTSSTLDFSTQGINGPFLLIAYCHANARYLYKVADPFTHDVKRESRAFGDRLASHYHPLVYY